MQAAEFCAQRLMSAKSKDRICVCEAPPTFIRLQSAQYVQIGLQTDEAEANNCLACVRHMQRRRFHLQFWSSNQSSARQSATQSFILWLRLGQGGDLLCRACRWGDQGTGDQACCFAEDPARSV